jgi:hypothetical protein
VSTTEIDWIIKVEEGKPSPMFLGHKFWFWYVVEKRTTIWQNPYREHTDPIVTKTPYSQGSAWSKNRAIKAAKKYVDEVMKRRMYRQESENDILYRGEPVDY